MERAPNDADKDALKDAMATQLEMDASALKNFAVVAQVVTARHARALLSTNYLWAVAFDVVVSLADTDADDAASLALLIGEEMMDESLADTIEANVGVAVEIPTSSISVVQSTRTPTLAPVAASSQRPSSNKPTIDSASDDKRSRKGAASASSSVMVVAAAVIAVCLLVAGACFVKRYSAPEQKKSAKDESDVANRDTLDNWFPALAGEMELGDWDARSKSITQNPFHGQSQQTKAVAQKTTFM